MCTFIYRTYTLLSLLWLAFLFDQTLAGVSNRTIDDVFGDSVTRQLPIFLPENLGVWKDQTCGDCAINPDKSHAYNGTYHSATYNPDLKSINVTINFDGTAIYVFLILANNAGPGIDTRTICVFKLDGTTIGTFRHVPSTTTDIQFDVLAFSKADIPSGNHQLVIATEGLAKDSYLNFDYAIYTHDDNTTSTTTSSDSATSPSSPSTPSTSLPQSNNNKVPTGAIAGGVIGGVACLAAIGSCLFFKRCRQRRNIKRINLLGDSDGDTLNITTGPLYLPEPSTISPFVTTGTSSKPGARPTQTSEIPRSSNLPSENHLPSTPHLSSYMPPSSPTTLVVSNPGHQRPIKKTQQAELKKRVTTMNQKFENLRANITSQMGSTAESEVVKGRTTTTSSVSDGTPPTVNVEAMQAQIRMLTEEVSLLEAQQSFPWIRNPILEPPPDYTSDRRDDEWSSRSANI